MSAKLLVALGSIAIGSSGSALGADPSCAKAVADAVLSVSGQKSELVNKPDYVATNVFADNGKGGSVTVVCRDKGTSGYWVGVELVKGSEENTKEALSAWQRVAAGVLAVGREKAAESLRGCLAVAKRKSKAGMHESASDGLIVSCTLHGDGDGFTADALRRVR